MNEDWETPTYIANSNISAPWLPSNSMPVPVLRVDADGSVTLTDEQWLALTQRLDRIEVQLRTLLTRRMRLTEENPSG